MSFADRHKRGIATLLVTATAAVAPAIPGGTATANASTSSPTPSALTTPSNSGATPTTDTNAAPIPAPVAEGQPTAEGTFVFSPSPDTNPFPGSSALYNNPLPSNPNDLLLSTLSPYRGDDVPWLIQSHEYSMGSNPTLALVNESVASKAVDDIIATIEQQVEKNGPLNTLAITGDSYPNSTEVSLPATQQQIRLHHGLPGAPDTSPADLNFDYIWLPNLMDRLVELQNEKFGGRAIAKRFIVFGCHGGSNLSLHDADLYSERAKQLGFPVIMATSFVNSVEDAPDQGYFVQFNPDGTVSNAPINNPDPNILNAQSRGVEEPRQLNNQAGWVKRFMEQRARKQRTKKDDPAR